MVVCDRGRSLLFVYSFLNEVKMYKLSSTNSWYDGMKFDSLGQAIEKCRKCQDACDVLALVDRDHFRAVFSNKADILTGTYKKQ